MRIRFDQLAAVLVCFGLACGLSAHDPEDANHAQDHDHHHRHVTIGEEHPTTLDPDRFETNRHGGAILVLPSEQDAFTFAVFGDRTGGPAEGIEVLKQAVADTNLIEPDLVMTVGDLVQGYTDAPEWMTEMREYKNVMSNLLMPWFPVAGNHDIYWRGNGAKPEGENESIYEINFGPLWYAFEHKNCWFIALYSDEGNPETGEKDFNKPECQRMSPEQFKWLKKTLENAKDADHIFLFLHHPRWLKNNYGDDWDRVHELLASAGNVTAVFAGHIHKMRYDGVKDGIEYVTLATVGGAQSGLAPEAGYLHQFHLVTVRKNQIALASIPVGEVTDVRKLTGQVSDDAAVLSRVRPTIEDRLPVDMQGFADGYLVATVKNPVSRPIDVSVFAESEDSRWSFIPDHEHGTLQPGETLTFRTHASRVGGTIDDTLRPAELSLQMDYLAEGLRYSIPETTINVPVYVDLPAPKRGAAEMVARFDGVDDALRVDSDLLPLHDGPMTLECWFNAKTFGNRTGLVCKTENSDYGFFVNNGKPAFYIYLGNSYVEAASDDALPTDKWHHLAGVFDGKETRLYVNGQLVKSTPRSARRRTNALPLYIGADVDPAGNPMSFFDGSIDAVRLSDVARYAGQSFEPARHFDPDEHALLLLNMDGVIGPWIYDDSPNAAHPTVVGDPLFVED